MVSRYVTLFLVACLVGGGAWIKILQQRLDSTTLKLEAKLSELVQCKQHNEHLIGKLEEQNLAISEANTKLNNAQTKLDAISISNKKLRQRIEKLSIGSYTKRKTCEDTMQFMLEEALRDEPFSNTIK